MLLLFPCYCLLAALSLASSVCGNQEEVSRVKRQLISGITCPKAEPTADDAGKSAFLLFYSPKQRKDVKISYDSDGWSQDEMATLNANGFNSHQPTLIYSHAYHQSSRSGWLLDIRAAYDRMYRRDRDPTGFNLMFFDWSKYSQMKYANAVGQVPALGRVLGEFLERLGKSYNLAQVHLVGYSLSPHILGAASRQAGARVGQITALDPTGVCLPDKVGLKASDARLVVARHYDMGALGASQPLGALDIFVNGGRAQPLLPRNGGRQLLVNGENPLLKMKSEQEATSVYAKDRFGGSHARAQEHEAQQVEDECHEVAYECPSYEQFLAGQCADCGPQGDRCYFINNLQSLQYAARSIKTRAAGYKAPSKMYIKTGSGSPGYCLHHYQAVMQLKPTAANKQLVASTNFDFGPHLQVRFRNQTGGGDQNRYTALVTLNKRLPAQLSTKVSALIDGYRKQDHEEAAQKLVNAVDWIEINYMSHALASERAKLSFKLCASKKPSSSAEKFTRC